MKKILLLLMLFPLTVFSQKKNFTLSGKIATYSTPYKISLEYTLKGKKVKISSDPKNGYFSLNGFVDSIQNGYLLLENPGRMTTAKLFWLEPGNLKANATDEHSELVFSGTKMNDDNLELGRLLKPCLAVEDENQREALKNSLVKKFILQHPNSLLSLIEISYVFSRGVPDIAVVEPLFNGLSPAVKGSTYGKAYRIKLNEWKKVDIGSVAPDFVQPDTSGKKLRLSDFKGKYVLLDFWASWCHPCRDENPNLIKQFNIYKDKGFDILSLSIDGAGFGTRESWMKAIKEDKVGIWKHVSDLTGNKNAVPKMYGVGSIPENFLIDPNGKIIAKSLRGDQLGKVLQQIFSANTPAINNSDAPADTKFINPDSTSTPSPGTSSTPSSAMPTATGVKFGEREFADMEVLPLDTATRTGKLPNGFTYYIRKNKQPENRVYFYLANKIGSILENDDQQGLAHFMEHMNFNGTTHFPKNELVNYLQTAGVRFGADINAYTGFNETVYQLPLPGDNKEVVANGIKIMHDWAQGALLDENEINKERGVILEEGRLRKGAGARMQQKMFPVLFNGSRYALRIPIGIDTVLKSFKPETIRQFFHDWYRPNLQALIVIGDIDPIEMEKRVIAEFADLKNPVNERKRNIYKIPLTGKNQFIKLTDPEQTNTIIQVVIKHEEPNFKTAADYKQYLIKQLFDKMTGSRFGELGDSGNNPPFLNAGGGVNSLLANLDQYSVSAVSKPGKLKESFKAVWYTTEQIKKFGFTSTELARAKDAILQTRLTAVNEKDKTYSGEIVNEYVQTFLNEIPSPGVMAELQLSRQYLPKITLDDLLKFSNDYIQNTNRDIMVMGPEKDIASLPDERVVNQWITEVQAGKILPYQDKFKERQLMTRLPVPGKIVHERALPEIKATEWILSNGAKVIVKPTNFEADDVDLQIFSQGGNSMFPDKQYFGLANLPIIITTSGIGDFSYKELNDFLSGKKLGYGFGMDTYDASFVGNSNNKYKETLLQIVYLYFTQPRKDQKVFEGEIARLKASVKEIKDPEEIFNDTVSAVILNKNIRSKHASLEQISQIRLDEIFDAHKKQFGNAANFSFVFIGNIDTLELKPLVEKYIASLPSSSERLKAKDVHMYPPPGKISKTVYRGLENKSQVNLTFSGQYKYDALNNKLLDALKEIILFRMINRLREQESGAYSPDLIVSHVRFPEERYRLRIGFGCAPENVEKLIAAALDEINKLKTFGPNDVELEKFKAEELSRHQLSLRDNNGWSNFITEQLSNNGNLNDINNYDALMQKITADDIKAAANLYLSGENLIRIVLMPESLRPRK